MLPFSTDLYFVHMIDIHMDKQNETQSFCDHELDCHPSKQLCTDLHVLDQTYNFITGACERMSGRDFVLGLAPYGRVRVKVGDAFVYPTEESELLRLEADAFLSMSNVAET